MRHAKTAKLSTLQRRADAQLVAWSATPRESREWWLAGAAYLEALNDCRKLQGYTPLQLPANYRKEAI